MCTNVKLSRAFILYVIPVDVVESDARIESKVTRFVDDVILYKLYDIVLSEFDFPTKDPLDPPFNVIVGVLEIALLNVKLNSCGSVLIRTLLLFPVWFVVYSINAPVVNVNGPVFRP